MVRLAALLLMTVSSVIPAYAQERDSSTELETPAQQTSEPAMTLERMDDILRALDPDIQADGARFILNIEDVQVFVIADVSNNRMRVITPIRAQEGITSSEMTRMMQANFDSALDARYAIAQDTLWSVYIHPLSPLEKNQLISGIGQVINLVRSYGSVYSSGELSYGGGDSNGINRQLIERLLEQGEEV